MVAMKMVGEKEMENGKMSSNGNNSIFFCQ
jgi:hypothetical protein